MHTTTTRRRALACATLAAALASLHANAATLNWDGGGAGTGRTWSASANWSPETAPSTGDDLIIGVGALGGSATQLGGGSYLALSVNASPYTATIRSLTLSNVNSYFPSGTLLLQNSNAATAQPGTIVFNTPSIDALTVASGNVTIASRTAAQMTVNLGYTGQGSFSVASGSTLTFDSTNNTTAMLTGTGGINKTGAGTLVLTGTANDFTGGLTITNGTVGFSISNRLGSEASLNANAVVLNGGTLSKTTTGATTSVANRGFAIGNSGGTINIADAAGTMTISGVVANVASESGRLTKTGPGTLVLSGANTLSGGVAITEGTVRITGSGLGALPGSPVADQVSINGGRLQFDGASDFASGTNRGFTLGPGNAEIAVTNTGVYSTTAIVAGSGSLTKTGTGSFYLNGGASNTYSGGTTVAEGTLLLGRTASMGSGSVQLGVVGGGDASIIANLGGWTQANNITVASGALGTLRLGGNTGGSFNNLFSGSIAINGNLEITSATIATFATRTTGVLSGTGDVTKVGTGEWRIENSANTWAGDLAINEGSVNLLSGANLRFNLADGGATNSVSGTGVATFDGLFRIDASAVTGNGTWSLVNVGTLSETFGSSFSLGFVSGPAFTDAGGGLYTSGDWTFNTGTGALTLAAIPEPSAFAALAGLGILGFAATRRRRA